MLCHTGCTLQPWMHLETVDILCHSSVLQQWLYFTTVVFCHSGCTLPQYFTTRTLPQWLYFATVFHHLYFATVVVLCHSISPLVLCHSGCTLPQYFTTCTLPKWLYFATVVALFHGAMLYFATVDVLYHGGSEDVTGNQNRRISDWFSTQTKKSDIEWAPVITENLRSLRSFLYFTKIPHMPHHPKPLGADFWQTNCH